MQTQRAELLHLLPDHGWRVAGTEDDLDWWAYEMWELESVWSPVGSRAYITFLVDPQFDGPGEKGEAVWAVMASLFKPVSHLRGEHEFLLNVGPGWNDFLPVFFIQLSTLRGVSPS